MACCAQKFSINASTSNDDSTKSISERKVLIKKADSIVIHSGNVLYDLLKTSDEICKSFCGVVQRWIEGKPNTTNKVTGTNCLSVTYLPSDESVNSTESREQLKIIAKLFLEVSCADVVEEAVMKVIEDLNCDQLDTVMLSLPPTSDCPTQTFRTIKYQDLKEIWIKLEHLVDKGLISSLGVCDFDASSLEDLHNSSRIKPVVDQITLEQCCTPPEDLMAYSSANNIEVLTHNDPNVILPATTLRHVLPEPDESSMWTAVYIVKYSTIVRFRQIVKSKGYILSMKRHNPK